MNSLIKINIVAIIFAISFSAEMNADCTNPLVITDVTNPPVITEPTCIKFDESITEIPDSIYSKSDYPERGGKNITGVIGENVVNIGAYAFEYNQITELSLSNIETIERSAFSFNQITELSMPNVESIGDDAFYGNFFITELSLPNVIDIGRDAFSVNTITKLYLPKVKFIDDNAFKNDPYFSILGFKNKIIELTLPNVEIIKEAAFYDTETLELTLPNVRFIDRMAFAYCPLKAVTLGTDFTIPKLIKADSTELGPFYAVKTEEADLVLGEFVLPERDGNKWNGYTWKSITILGITENSIATHLTISPNPTYSDAIISFCLLEGCDITFEICDVLGNILYTISNFYNAGEHNETLNTSDLPSGNYLCRMLAKNKQIANEKFAVVR
ncbi:MAG: leucine-rich repeat protein [Bacteroidetes bacterium]|nr:leucine-rich repeat protein [Bacteroidota bacterium]